MRSRKLKSLDQLDKKVRELKKKRKRIVLANGCFDLVHVGHVRYLEAARSLGDCLIVGINSDRSARRLKGPGRPVVKARERAEIISAFECVDYCFIFEEPTLDSCISRLRPHVHAKGTDYTRRTVPERATVLKTGGRVEIVGDRKSHSTKDLVEIVLTRFTTKRT